MRSWYNAVVSGGDWGQYKDNQSPSIERALVIYPSYPQDNPASIGFPVERSHVGVSQLPHPSAFRNLYIPTCPILHRRLETLLEAISEPVAFCLSTSLLCLLSRCTYHPIHNPFACLPWDCFPRLFTQWRSRRVASHLPKYACLVGTSTLISSPQNGVAQRG